MIILVGATSGAIVFGLMMAIVNVKKKTQQKLYEVYKMAQAAEKDIG